ncbi:hypothetical protein SprV_0200798000 [Sparganum proliferum]
MLHRDCLDRSTDANETAFFQCRHLAQQRLLEMQDAWTARKAEGIQGYAEHHETYHYFAAIKAMHGPTAKGTALLLSASDGDVTDVKRWAEDLGRSGPEQTGAAIYEANWIAVAKAKREARKSQAPRLHSANHPPLRTCPNCQRGFCALIGLVGHIRTQRAIMSTSTSSPTLASVANPATTAILITANHTVAVPPPPSALSPTPASTQRPASPSPRLPALPLPMSHHHQHSPKAVWTRLVPVPNAIKHSPRTSACSPCSRPTAAEKLLEQTFVVHPHDTTAPAQFNRVDTEDVDNLKSNRPERRTTLIERELARYKVDIATLSETCFAEQRQLEEAGVGYTFFWSDRPKEERRDAGVAFAIQNDIQNWFDDNNVAISNLLTEKNRLHKAYANRPIDDNKAAFYRSRHLVNQQLREMQDTWTAGRKSQRMGELLILDQGCLWSANQRNCSSSQPRRQCLLTGKTQILQRWAEHFRNVLNHSSTNSDAAIARLPRVETSANLDLSRSLSMKPPGPAADLQRESSRIGRDP